MKTTRFILGLFPILAIGALMLLLAAISVCGELADDVSHWLNKVANRISTWAHSR